MEGCTLHAISTTLVSTTRSHEVLQPLRKSSRVSPGVQKAIRVVVAFEVDV
jgi:hypothetical protein